MREQDAIAQEAAWEQDVEALQPAIERVYAEHEAIIARRLEDLEAAEADLEEASRPLLAERDRLWDRIWESREARGIPVPFVVRLRRMMVVSDTPLLNRMKAGRSDGASTVKWGPGNAE